MLYPRAEESLGGIIPCIKHKLCKSTPRNRVLKITGDEVSPSDAMTADTMQTPFQILNSRGTEHTQIHPETELFAAFPGDQTQPSYWAPSGVRTTCSQIHSREKNPASLTQKERNKSLRLFRCKPSFLQTYQGSTAF